MKLISEFDRLEIGIILSLCVWRDLRGAIREENLLGMTMSGKGLVLEKCLFGWGKKQRAREGDNLKLPRGHGVRRECQKIRVHWGNGMDGEDPEKFLFV